MTGADVAGGLLVLGQESQGKGPAIGDLAGVLIIVGIALGVALVAFAVLRFLLPAYRRSRRVGGGGDDG